MCILRRPLAFTPKVGCEGLSTSNARPRSFDPSSFSCATGLRMASTLSHGSPRGGRGATLPGLVARRSGEGRGVFAKRSFREADLVLRVPKDLCLQVKGKEGAGELAKRLLSERHRGEGATGIH